ncbi:MAG: hypothetical protein LIO68_03955 [Rikenellaceae bacterium]|nr:hypothetical protein [Rikenellaceae bacterium]
MLAETINNELIEAMREKLPEGVNLAGLLMDTLYIGKEAVYRRLRGEVPFTLAEAATVSRKMGISLDKLLGAAFNGNALFNLNIVQHGDPMETYYTILSGYVETFRKLENASYSELGTSSNIIPQTSYLKYDALAKFRLFKWLYQHESADFTKCYEETVLPQKLLDRQKEFVSCAQQVKSTCHVWDKMMFQHLVNDIKYFAGVHLISDENVRLMKQELLELIDELEGIASKGQFASGNDVQIFISNINFEATYSYLESGPLQLALIRVYSINSITSHDPEVFCSIKAWIQSLRKFSTLISQSGEMQRILFFKRQREIVAEL